MQILKDRIQKDGFVTPDNMLNISSFFSQQVDVDLYNEIGKEFHKRFSNAAGITKILTVEVSGIGIACVTAQYFKVPVVIARKFPVKNSEQELYTQAVRSYTLGVDYTVSVPKKFLTHNDTVLLIDDFLGHGHALEGLTALAKMAKAQLVGAGIVIEKGFQDGGKRLRENRVRIESLATIESMSPEGGVRFKGE